MGSISNLMDRLSRKHKADHLPISVTTSGFSVGDTFVPWQSIAEIWGYKVDLLTTDEAFVEFVAIGRRVAVSEEHPGFGELEVAMAEAFPTTATWRQSVLLPAFAECRTLLYRRA